MNQLTIIGRVGQDPVRKDVNGQALATFSVATSEKWKDQAGTQHEETTWHNVEAWGKLGELCGQYLSKGRQVAVVGKVKIRKGTGNHEGKTFYSVSAVNVEFLGSKDDGAPRAAAPATQPTHAQAPMQPSFTEEDVPF